MASTDISTSLRLRAGQRRDLRSAAPPNSTPARSRQCRARGRAALPAFHLFCLLENYLQSRRCPARRRHFAPRQHSYLLFHTRD
ncbi:hypothetical protein B0H10DRAFT_2027366, partial [Mycena sp. CBHHK59/15]